MYRPWLTLIWIKQKWLTQSHDLTAWKKKKIIFVNSGITYTGCPQVSQLEQDLEKERTALSQALRRREREVEEATQEVQKKERQAAELSGSITWDHLAFQFLNLPFILWEYFFSIHFCVALQIECSKHVCGFLPTQHGKVWHLIWVFSRSG